MSKTLREWLDSLPSGTIYELRRMCDWLDPGSPTGYRNFNMSSKVTLSNALRNSRSYRSDQIFSTIAALAFKGEIEVFEEKDMDKVWQLADDSDSDFIFKLPMDIAQKQRVKQDLEEFNGKLSLSTILFTTEDFDKIDYSNLSMRSLTMSDDIAAIFDKDFLKAYYKENPRKLTIDTRCDVSLIDELFFCEDGWSDADKKNFIEANYRGARSLLIQDFFERIVAVDKSYLKYIGTIIQGDPALADQLYYEKKPASEIGPNDPVYMTFRYPREIRKLFQIAGCCARGTMPKTRAAKCGDVAAILKLYNYNFNDIFNAMYPEFMEEVASTEELTA